MKEGRAPKRRFETIQFSTCNVVNNNDAARQEFCASRFLQDSRPATARILPHHPQREGRPTFLGPESTPRDDNITCSQLHGSAAICGVNLWSAPSPGFLQNDCNDITVIPPSSVRASYRGDTAAGFYPVATKKHPCISYGVRFESVADSPTTGKSNRVFSAFARDPHFAAVDQRSSNIRYPDHHPQHNKVNSETSLSSKAISLVPDALAANIG